ncbi:interleukin-10 receptor subunit alpha [Spea bombifrons]|uniref:interleukin-10 receptor subunit alpha n=1 Tax=Spea bombifrons TaxID=233779 RepID=UPI00234C026E|nr:interleukin-10 receptor subunit alpha [Spea bombifrons]
MAVLGACELGLLLIASAGFFLIAPGRGDILSAPTDVHFEMEFFQHILSWSPGNSSSLVISYEVEFLRYGNATWNPVPHCFLTYNLTCDLTVETLPVAVGYYARVRSVSGNQTSAWVRTERYSVREVKLAPPYVSLYVDGSSLVVQLSLPEIHYKNLTLRYDDLFPFNLAYAVHVRRTTDNHSFVQVEDILRFHVTGLVAGNEYCVSVQTFIRSRRNIGTLSNESCLWISMEEHGSNILMVVACSILAVMAFMIFINVFICLYIRKTVKTPTTLKSLMKRSWSWMDKPATPTEGKISLHWESDLIDHRMTESRNSLICGSTDSGFGSQIFPERFSQPCPVVIKCSRHDSMLDIQGTDSEICVITQPEDVSVSIMNSEILDGDSGISLSTGSPCLKRSCSSGNPTYGADTQGSKDAFMGIKEDEKCEYLRQPLIDNKQRSLEEKDMLRQCLIQSKDYLSQEPQKLHSERSDQEKCLDFQGPWIQIPEVISLGAAFSPFSQVLWGLSVSPLTLGDIELMDTRS